MTARTGTTQKKRKRDETDESIRISKDILAEIRKIAKENHRTIKGQIEYMLEEGMKKNGDENCR